MHCHEVADVVHMQVTGEDLVELRKIRSQGEQVSQRASPYIEQEFVTIAQFNEIRNGDGCLSLVWHTGTESGDPHFIGTEQLGIGKITGWVLPIDNRSWRASDRHIVFDASCITRNNQDKASNGPAYHQQGITNGFDL